LRLLDEYRRSFTPAYETVVGAIENTLRITPTGRPAKSTTSIVEKLRRETVRLSQIQDIAGCRIVFVQSLAGSVGLQDQIVAAARDTFPDAAIIDRRVAPSHGYRAVHVVPRIDGRPVEIQIRTALQHLWAEVSEKLADVIDPGLKYGTGPKRQQQALLEASRIIADAEKLGERGGTDVEKQVAKRYVDLVKTLSRIPELFR
jgi:putative GTP pyrophosphokinase